MTCHHVFGARALSLTLTQQIRTNRHDTTERPRRVEVGRMPEDDGLEVRTEVLETMHFASMAIQVDERDKVVPEVREAAKRLEDVAVGPPMAVLDWFSVKDCFTANVGCPVDGPVQADGMEVRELEPVEVMSAFHKGPYSSIRETYLKMYGVMRERGVLPSTTPRETFHRMDGPDDMVVEIQWPLRDWTCLMAEGIDEVMGPEARDHVMEGSEALNPDTPREERFAWVMAALARLDGIADVEQRYWALSRCADPYPKWRLDELREIFTETRSVDEVLDGMKGDTDWYSTPRRDGNLIYHTKVPYDREAWEKATDRRGRRASYCHCALVQDRLDEVEPSYCYCGTGWVRQVWEHVLDRPIRIEVLRSLPAGDEECQFLIHLPDEVVQEG